jgi:hypothetical protein
MLGDMRLSHRIRRAEMALLRPFRGRTVRRVVVPGFLALAAWWWWTDTASASTSGTVEAGSDGGAVDDDFADMVGDLQGTMADFKADMHRTEVFVAQVKADVQAFDTSLDTSTAQLDHQIDRQVEELVAAALDRPLPPPAPVIVEMVVEAPVIEAVVEVTTNVAVAVDEIAPPPPPPAAHVDTLGHGTTAIVSSSGTASSPDGSFLLREGRTSTIAMPASASQTTERVERSGPQLAALLDSRATLVAGLILAAFTVVVTLSDGLGARPPTTPD